MKGDVYPFKTLIKRSGMILILVFLSVNKNKNSSDLDMHFHNEISKFFHELVAATENSSQVYI